MGVPQPEVGRNVGQLVINVCRRGMVIMNALAVWVTLVVGK